MSYDRPYRVSLKARPAILELKHLQDTSKLRNENRVRVCVPVCAKSFADMETACARARELGDVVELRLDCVEDNDVLPRLQSLTGKDAGPFILTFRPSEQGGHRVLSRAEREAFWKGDWDASRTALADIESDLVCDKDASFIDGPFDWSRVIVSHHDFNGVPADLEEIYKRLARSLADVVKIAVQANDITDCLPVFNLLDRAHKENRNLIAIAMGDLQTTCTQFGGCR